jgi:hypothetical protein
MKEGIMSKKGLTSLVCGLAVVFLMTSFVSAKNPKGPSGPAGKSNVAHLYLYEKSETDWQILEKGAWGKMKYRTSGPSFNFVFNGKKLIPGGEYTLIYYPDPWPGNGLICLGTGVANGGGNVHIKEAAFNVPDLPILDIDLNHPENPGHQDCIDNSTCIEGAKIWLVLSSDVECNTVESVPPHMIGWNPAEYLFEDIGILFDYMEPVTP